MIENTRCVILNASYEPLSVVSAKRGLILVLEGKAMITEAHPNGHVQSVTKKFPLPTQIRLKDYIKSRPVFHIPAQLTQRNLFLRDHKTCQYCGRKASELEDGEYLTRDHVIPESLGGKDSWTNVVTACRKCNNIKADSRLEDMDKLYYKYAEQAENAALAEDRKYGKETSEWIMEHFSDVHLTPRAPTVFELWSRGDLKLGKRKKRKERKEV